MEKRLAKEHALEQQLEREMAAKAQRYAFRQAARDLANAHVAELGRLRDIARHREDRCGLACGSVAWYGRPAPAFIGPPHASLARLTGSSLRWWSRSI